jgi:sensor c-di-GMP phosphodiesterase-like protein
MSSCAAFSGNSPRTCLRFNVVAEGVETEMQREVLLDLGCDHMQGYLFSKPVPEDKLFKLCKSPEANFESKNEFLSIR